MEIFHVYIRGPFNEFNRNLSENSRYFDRRLINRSVLSYTAYTRRRHGNNAR